MSKIRKLPDMNLPVWFDSKNINEALFCEEFLHERRIIFANGAFFTPDGRVTDALPLRGEIYEKLKCCAENQQHSGGDEAGSAGGGLPTGAGSDSSFQRNAASGRHFYRGQAGDRAEPSAGCLSSRHT